MTSEAPGPQCAVLAEAGKVLEAVEVARKLFAAEDRVAAKQEADAIRETMPQTADNLMALFKLYVDLDARELAQQTASRLFQLEPNHIGGRRGMATLQLMMWKLDKVRPHLIILLDTPGLSADDLLFVAKVYLRFGTPADSELACQLIRRSIKAAGTSSLSTKIILVEALIATGQVGAALREAEAFSETAKSALDLATIAELYAKISRPTEALAVARRGAAVAQPPGDPAVVKIMLAHTFIKLGRLDEARPLLESIDHTAISGTWLLRRFHDACFDAQLGKIALVTAKRLKIMSPDDPVLPKRIVLLSLMGDPPSPVSQAPPETKSFLSNLFRSRKTT